MPRRLLIAGLVALPLLLLWGCEKRIREAGMDRPPSAPAEATHFIAGRGGA